MDIQLKKFLKGSIIAETTEYDDLITCPYWKPFESDYEIPDDKQVFLSKYAHHHCSGVLQYFLTHSATLDWLTEAEVKFSAYVQTTQHRGQVYWKFKDPVDWEELHQDTRFFSLHPYGDVPGSKRRDVSEKLPYIITDYEFTLDEFLKEITEFGKYKRKVHHPPRLALIPLLNQIREKGLTPRHDLPFVKDKLLEDNLAFTRDRSSGKWTPRRSN